MINAVDLMVSTRKTLKLVEADLEHIRSQTENTADFLDPERALNRLQTAFGSSADLVTRWIALSAPATGALIVYFTGVVNPQQVETAVVKPLMQTRRLPYDWADAVMQSASVQGSVQWHHVLQELPRGKVAVFAPGLPWAWLADAAQLPARSVSSPDTERDVRGPKEAFSSLMSTQMAQLRSRIPDGALRMESLTLGLRQQTSVTLVYLESLANPELVQMVRDRVRHVTVDSIPMATELGGIIRDHPRSIFPTIRNTERVDLAIMFLYEGKVLILVDSDPFALVAPAPLSDFYRTAMDYSSSWIDTTFVRLIRFGGWAMGIYLPAIYVAAAAVNPNLVPYALQVLMIGAHTGMPFSPVVEAFFLIFVIEVLREAALRLPKDLSTTIGTVGAIVVGTAVVKAGLVSPQMIVIITLTALSFFSVPVYALTGTWRIVNFAMLVFAAIFGFWGIIVVTFVLIGILCQMQSFGTPYFVPWGPFRGADWKDLLLRVPWTQYYTRLTAARPRQAIRMAARTVRAEPPLQPMDPRPDHD